MPRRSSGTDFPRSHVPSSRVGNRIAPNPSADTQLTQRTLGYVVHAPVVAVLDVAVRADFFEHHRFSHIHSHSLRRPGLQGC